jgi:hypothetical protein
MGERGKGTKGKGEIGKGKRAIAIFVLIDLSCRT